MRWFQAVPWNPSFSPWYKVVGWWLHFSLSWANAIFSFFSISWLPPFLSPWSHSVSACESRRLVHSRAWESPRVPVVSLPEWEIMEIDQNTNAWEGEATRAIFGNRWSRYLLKHRMPHREREDYNKRCNVKMSFNTPFFFSFLSQLLCAKWCHCGSMSKFWVGPVPKSISQKSFVSHCSIE